MWRRGWRPPDGGLRETRRRLTGDLAVEEEGDQQRVDDQRLDERQAEDHRREQLVRGAGVARDAFESGGSGAALAERATECGDAEADGGRDGVPTGVFSLDQLGTGLSVSCRGGEQGERRRRPTFLQREECCRR